MAILVIAAGQKREPEPEIAGDYAVADGRACLGAGIQVAQSGRFIRLGNAQGTLGGEMQEGSEHMNPGGSHNRSGHSG